MTHVRKALILAAGVGRRLGPHTSPKPLVEVAGVPITHRALRALSAAGVREAVIVVGHRASEIVASIGDRFESIAVSYVHSEAFEETNNAYSLWLARRHLDQDLFLLDADVVFDQTVLSLMAAVRAPAVLAVAPWETGMNGTAVRLDGERVSRVYLREDQSDQLDMPELFKTVNIHLLRADYLAEQFIPRLEYLIEHGDRQAFYDAVIAETVNQGQVQARGLDCRDMAWQEIDDHTDLAAANYRFATADERLAQLGSQHGGYWRHEVTDHRLLYNLHFPPEPLWQALEADFRNSLVHYPSGRDTLEQLLASAIGLPPRQLVVANGAAELIKVLGQIAGDGDVVLTVPGFNEYEAVFDPARIHRVELDPPDFHLDIEQVHRVAAEAAARTVVITSPNNPTGRAAAPEDLLRLCKLLAPSGIRLILDESFIDFRDQDSSLQPCLGDHTNLAIIKSMSKVYGLAGLRLGYLATADRAFTAAARNALPIWNVNGIAESFLRHLPRFTHAFQTSLEKVRTDREELRSGLERIDGLDVLESDANFLLARLAPPWTGPGLVRELFARHNILIKDCAGKSMRDGERYVRIASRCHADNQRLITALAEVLGEGRP